MGPRFPQRPQGVPLPTREATSPREEVLRRGEEGCASWGSTGPGGEALRQAGKRRRRARRRPEAGPPVAETSTATLYCELPRPNSRESDFFDLITQNNEGKVLHVARQVSTLTPETLESFLATVKPAKNARNDRGDIGAALLVADAYTDTFLDAYESATADIASWMASMTESITGYEGFIRTGLRRGFHLLPVLRTDNGFEPILPKSD